MVGGRGHGLEQMLAQIADQLHVFATLYEPPFAVDLGEPVTVGAADDRLERKSPRGLKDHHIRLSARPIRSFEIDHDVADRMSRARRPGLRKDSYPLAINIGERLRITMRVEG